MRAKLSNQASSQETIRPSGPASAAAPKVSRTRRTATLALGGVPAAYSRLQEAFAWDVPVHFNIAHACCIRWAQSEDASKLIAVRAYYEGQPDQLHSYLQLQEQANRLSNALAALGVVRADRVAIVMPQCFETAVAYMAVLQMGAVAVPLSQLFGPEALEFRLQDSEAVVAICDLGGLDNLHKARPQCALLRSVIAVGGGGEAGEGSTSSVQPPDAHYTQARWPMQGHTLPR